MKWTSGLCCPAVAKFAAMPQACAAQCSAAPRCGPTTPRRAAARFPEGVMSFAFRRGCEAARQREH